MGAFDALVDELDRFQRWKSRKARKAAPMPQARPAPAAAPGRTTPAQSFGKAMDTMAAELVELRRQTAGQTARLCAQMADAERQRGFATLDGIMQKAMDQAANGLLTPAEVGSLEIRCRQAAARLHAQARAEKQGRATR